jgi:hypothetical protein
MKERTLFVTGIGRPGQIKRITIREATETKKPKKKDKRNAKSTCSN